MARGICFFLGFRRKADPCLWQAGLAVLGMTPTSFFAPIARAVTIRVVFAGLVFRALQGFRHVEAGVGGESGAFELDGGVADLEFAG